MYVTAFSQTYFFFVEFNLGALSGSIGFRSVHEIQIVNFHQIKATEQKYFSDEYCFLYATQGGSNSYED